MNRTDLGERLCQWHSSMHDPVYAVGSFYVSNQVYPDKEVVNRALSSLEKDLSEFKRMLRGKVVLVTRNGAQVSLKKFAGYTNKDCREHITDLSEIVDSLKEQMSEDYPE